MSLLSICGLHFKYHRTKVRTVRHSGKAEFCMLPDWCLSVSSCWFNLWWSTNSVGTWWHSWLRHWATSRRVTGSIPNGVNGIFHWHTGCTMALRLTQPLTEMSTGDISWRPVRRTDNLTTFMCRLSWNLGASNSWNPQGLSRPVMGLLYLYIYRPWKIQRLHRCWAPSYNEKLGRTV